jgi:chemotaxis protein methyltransferase CheR
MPTANKPPTEPAAGGQINLSKASFARFAGFITAELGIKMPETKRSLVQNRLQRRIRDLGMASIDEYGDYFFAPSNAAEREHFINAITTNKTDFFREKEHFSYLFDVVLPEMSPSIIRHQERFKVWSAGCSSGEEAFTLAMLLADCAASQPGLDFSILGTDISTKVLEVARRGIYPESQVVPVPLALRRKYLLSSVKKAHGLNRVVPALRRKVSFHELNFMDEDYRIIDLFHAIFFRNVMIYFDRDTQEAVINKICRHLVPGGYLFVGHSESIAGLNIPLKSVKTSVYRKFK